MMTGDRIRAEEALRLGLLNQVYPLESFWEDTLSFARTLATGPAETLARIKEGVYLGATVSLEQALAYEYRAQKAAFLSDDAREGMRASWTSARPNSGRTRKTNESAGLVAPIRPKGRTGYAGSIQAAISLRGEFTRVETA